MSIRLKVFLALLVFSLGPMLIAGLLARGNVMQSRQRITDSTRQQISTIADDTRRHIVQKYAAILERDRALIELTVLASAEHLARQWRTGPSDEMLKMRFYTGAEFDDPDIEPPGLYPDYTMSRFNADGTRETLYVSNDTPVYVRPDGMSGSEFRREAAILASLVPIMHEVTDSAKEVINPASHFAALESSGLHMSWPGKGGYPDDYQPRRRAWYQAGASVDAAAGQSVAWTPPTIDAPTGQVRRTCSAPVFADDPDPNDDEGPVLIGVVGVDITLDSIIRELDLPASFRKQSRAMIVRLDERDEELGRGPKIITSAQYDELAGAAWDSPITLENFSADDPDSGFELSQAMRGASRGSLDLELDGKPWVWTFERVNDAQTFVLVGISLDVADSAADGVAALITESIDATTRQNLVIGLVVFGAIAIVGFFGSRSITRPVRRLAEAASAIAGGDLDARADVRTGDELQRLADSFNIMVPKLRDRLQVRESLAVAQEVQQSLLPTETPSIDGLDIGARSVYCDETGGDYYDFFDLGGVARGVHAFVVGDVTGHGIGSALLMTTARALIHARADETEDIAALLSGVNTRLAVDARSGRFMTLFYLLVDTRDRSARWTSAGHDAAIVYDRDTSAFEELDGHDIPLGIDGTWEYTENSARLPERSVLVIGTDGIWEARNPDGDMFGKDRLRETIATHADLSGDEIAQAVLDTVTRFRAGEPQADDITLVVLKTVPTR